jgi:hypothetical protein
VRPLWLFGGGALLAVLGMCALISLVIAVPIVWLTVQRSPATAQPTRPAVVVLPTAQPQTATPATGITLTPLLIISTQAPTTIPQPTQTALRMPPDQLVRTYFQLVSQGRYDLTWPLLTDAFKQKFNCCAPNYNYSGYTAWWDSVDRVEFGSVNTVSQNGDRAVVYAELYYVMNTGARSGVDGSPYFALVYDSAMGSWRLDDKRANP